MTNPTPIIAPSQPAAAVEPRGWSRLNSPSEDTVVLIQRQGDTKRECLLVDRSLGGVAVRAQFSSWFQVGDEVSVEFFGAPVEAIVRQKRQLPDGTWRLGLEWIDGSNS